MNHKNIPNLVPLPDDLNLTHRPGYDYGARRLDQLQIVNTVQPAQSWLKKLVREFLFVVFMFSSVLIAVALWSAFIK